MRRSMALEKEIMSKKFEKLQGTKNLSAVISKEFGHLGFGSTKMNNTQAFAPTNKFGSTNFKKKKRG